VADRQSQREFIVFTAAVTALGAISIDVMLPAFADVRAAYELIESRTALIVTMYLLGTGIGQFVYGPLADRFGRVPTLRIGLTIYIVASFITTIAPTFFVMLVSRFIWGLGAAGARVITVAIVRDRYSGNEMARIMAGIMALFFMVPAVAPLLGRVVLLGFGWRATFAVGGIMAIGIFAWSFRLSESLNPDDRRAIDLKAIWGSAKEVWATKSTRGYGLALMFGFGAFFPFLGSSERIIGDLYGRPAQFAWWFSLISIIQGAVSITMMRILRTVPAQRLLTVALTLDLSVAVIFVTWSLASDGLPPFAAFFIMLTVMVSGNAVMISVLNSLAMEHVGRLAGTAAAVLGTLTFIGGSFLAAITDRLITDNVTPFATGFLVGISAAVVTILWTRRVTA